MTRQRLLSAAVISLSFLAHAEEVATTSATELTASIRLGLASGLPDLSVLAVSVMPVTSVEVEGGLTLLGTNHIGGYLRAGRRFRVLGARGQGFTLAFSALGGIRSGLGTSWADPLGGMMLVEGLGPNLVAALDATYWLLPRFGLTLQLVTGTTLYVASNGASTGLAGPLLGPDLRLTFGFSF